MIVMGMGRRGLVVAFLLVTASLLGMSRPAMAVGETPRTFNLYIRNHYESGDEAILARYDALGLDVDTPVATLNAIKALNPTIKLLAYIPINGTYQSGPLLPVGSKWREMYEAAETNGWWLQNTQGGHIFDHAGKYTINITTVCPENGSGQTMLDWYPEFIVNSVLQNGASPWDGVVLDDVWVGIWFINNNAALNPLPIDADQDGVPDDQPTLDQRWKDGNELITQRIRTMMPAGEILMGNGGNQFYHMNGAMIENFPFRGAPDVGHPLDYTWTDKMFGTLGYFSNENNYSATPQELNVVNAKWQAGSRYSADHTPDYGRHLRFCLASSMLRDGYFSIDFEEPTAGHHSLWWEPEFDKPIGTPTGAPYQVTYSGTTLWRRDYTNGSVILNNNYTTFLGSPANGIPPIGWVDARVLLSSEMWAPEVNLPGTIDDLAIPRTWGNQIEIEWTNVGDDGDNGQAVEVQARYSTSLITEANWAAATIVPGTVIPELPGLVQARLITGLAPNTTYHVAVKTRDLAGNWSALSNVPSAITVIGDVTAPAPVTNLAVLSTTSTGATVQWTTTGDDVNSGMASSFDLRYATFPLNASNFASGAQVVGEPTPGPPGTVQSLQLYGMVPFTTYYFAIKVGDEMPNWSGLSNVPSGTTQAGDITAPANVQDLRVINVGPNWVTLQWTAPGDDGNTGLATTYDLRYSPNVMTTQNFPTANFISGEPGPQAAGTVQTMTVSGFGTDRTYWFAIRASDEFPNWSGPSNIVSVTTNQPLPGDTTPPASITNLAVTGTTTTTTTLSWTAPGDDNSTGTATTYDLRYSTSTITAANFATATAVTGEPAPIPAGGSQGMTVTGLTSGIQYHFAIKTTDEVANWSTLSNVPSGTTQLATDTTPPAAVANLALGTWTQTSVLASWTSPGDDNAAGTATTYDLRFSTSAITVANFSSATPVASEPVPGLAGTAQSMTVSGLTAGTTYFFALKTSDEVPNISAISNVPSGSTLVIPDTTPPAAIANLSLGTWTQTSVLASWTSPGDDNAAGTATTYDLRFSTSAITAANFNSATPVVGEPVPAIAGTTQSMTVSGLTAGTTYFVALKTSDEVPNASTLSNVPSGSTLVIPDTTPPAAIANLALGTWTQTSVLVSWTSPGDDNVAGTATSYDLRFSTSAITAANFSSATPVVGEPVPAIAGTTQSMTVSGLTAGTSYFFAMKTSDEVPNTSAISNVPTGSTLVTPDTTPPAAVSTLALGTWTQTSVLVSWTSPGDDNVAGTATSYDLRFSTSAITAANFSSAIPVVGEPVPAIAGTTQSMTVSSLTAGTSYFFAMKTLDEVPNTSAISNVPTGSTLVTPDTTPPAAIANVTAGSWTQTSAVLSWTSPGDDNSAGTATSYDLRYSTSMITAANFSSATPVAGEPVPALAGTTQSMTVSGLTSGTTCFFALKTSDEVPNTSTISNVPSGSTLVTPDTTPPAAIANLALGTWTQTSVLASWTSPGDDNSAGTATTYDLRFSTSAITATNFASATPVVGEPVPALAGTAQSLTVSGLTSGTAYFFALKTSDEVPNPSAISNVPSGSTLVLPDTTPPAAIANLVLSTWTQTSVLVGWTSPGDDNVAGTATSYDLRFSTSAITAANFSSATPVASEPVPGLAGTAQSMTVSGLTAGTTYFFTLKTSDEVPNASAISNVPSGSTLVIPDTTPPAAIVNLTLGTWTQSSVLVSWTAPGDNNVAGTATSYDLRFSTSAITAANFNSATPVVGEPAPAIAETAQSINVSGLSAGTIYFFAMKTSDEVPNTSTISNVPTGSTLPPPDTTPPAAVSTLALGTWTQTTVLVGWTSPGDDNAAGTATSYDLRFSTSAITAANFSSATPVVGEPAPVVAGTTQSMTVSGLTPGTTFFFALKTSDEVPNTSTISNMPTGSTQPPPDTTPPAAATTLAVVAVTTTSATISWIAPGDDGVVGQASAYDVRWSSGLLTAEDFSAATPVTNLPVPAPAGTAEVMTLTGLVPGQTIWVALRTVDEAGNWSGLSNTPSATPPEPADELSPAGVTSLLVEAIGPGWMRVRWNAPGDDGESGQAAAYDLRVSTEAMTAITFNAGMAPAGEPTPAPAGVSQVMTLHELVPGLRHWVALKTVDDAGNWSSISNVVSGLIPALPDTTPPAEMTLQMVGVDTSSVVLQWIATGDDGAAGHAIRYEMRRMDGPMTEANFGSALPVPAPMPASVGTIESMTVTGLTPGSTWWFAIRAFDESGNSSPLSTSLRVDLMEAGDPPDTSPPLAPVGLNVQVENSNVRLSWSPNIEFDIVGYHVYRRPAGGSWLRRTPVAVAGLNWIDLLETRGGRFEYRLTAINARGEESSPSATLIVDIPDPDSFGLVITLSAPAPNPFTQDTCVRLAVPSGGAIRALIAVADIHGRILRTLHDGAVNEGEVEFEWNGRDDSGTQAPGGVYFVIVDSGSFRQSRKIVLAR